MKRALEEALTRCLARLDEGASIEDCLRDQGSAAAELRPLLEAAQALSGQSDDIPAHTPQAFQRNRVRMHAARARQAERGSGVPGTGFLLSRPARLTAIAMVIAVLAALGFTTGLFRFGAETTVADFQGIAYRVDPDVIALKTADGDLIIQIGDDTVVLDAAGNMIGGGDIAPGQPIRVEVEEDGDLTALRIEVGEDDDERSRGTEVEFSGVIKSVGDSEFTVLAAFGVTTVHIDSQGEVKGPLAQGATVEVHAILQGDGSYLAREIDVKDAEDRDARDIATDAGDEHDGSAEDGRVEDDNGDSQFDREVE